MYTYQRYQGYMVMMIFLLGCACCFERLIWSHGLVFSTALNDFFLFVERNDIGNDVEVWEICQGCID